MSPGWMECVCVGKLLLVENHYSGSSRKGLGGVQTGRPIGRCIRQVFSAWGK